MDQSMEKTFENRQRRRAKRLGFVLQKSRVRTIHMHDFGQYRLVDPDSNGVVAGAEFDLGIDDVAALLDQVEQTLLEERRNTR
jgi:hypothetical protein